MAKKRKSALNPDQLSRFLSVVTDRTESVSDRYDYQTAAELLQRWLQSSLDENSALPGFAKHNVDHLAQPFTEKSLGCMLLDPKSSVETLKAICCYAQELSSSARSEAEAAVAVAVYYGATASLLVHHDSEPAEFPYESLVDSFADLAAKKWMAPELRGLFHEACKVCQKRQESTDGASEPIADEKSSQPVDLSSDKQTSSGAPTASLDMLLEGPGTRIGHYRLLSTLGEGGMGIVHLAEQDRPIRRKVALKVIKPGMDSKRVIARFEVERQALALLDHPNIAHVFDAGTTDKGRPYFAMEYVKGLPITEYCDRHKLSVEDRLGVFLQVCQAVQHAHQKGIIHRDIKPSNILVTLQGDQAVPKVIDFGVARAISQPLTERTLHTEQGQLVGTPEYMSPEQVEMHAQDVDTRSDVYSLGVLLYVLLVGILPFDPKELREGGIDHIRQIVCEKDPKTPSTILRTVGGDESAKLAGLRQTDIRSLGRRLHGDLDWITLKAMDKDRSRRYETVSALAQDITRHLNFEPVQASPPSTAYRVRKFVRRHRGPVAAAFAVVTTLFVGLIVSAAMFFNAQQQRQRAEALLARAQIEKGTRLLNEGNRLGLLDLLEARTTADDIPNLRGSAARLWAIAYDFWSRQLIHVMPEGRDLAVSPDGRLLAIARRTTAELWNISTAEPYGPPLELGEAIAAVLFSPDGKLLAATSKRGVARLWDPHTGRPKGPILQQGEMADSSSYRARRSAAFSPDGTLLATALSNGTVQLWQTDTAVLHSPPLSHDADVICVAFSPDGRLLATGSRDNTAQLWTVTTGEPCGPPLQHDGPVEKVTFSPDGKLLATAGNRGKTYLWNTSPVRLHRQLTNLEWMHDLAFSPDGKLLAGGSFSWVARLWDADTGEPYGQELRHNSRVTQVAFSHDGKLLASASGDGIMHLRHVPSGEAYGQPLAHTGFLVFAPDAKLMATTGWGATRVWRLEQQPYTRVVPRTDGVHEDVVSASEELLVRIVGDVIEVEDAATGRLVGQRIRAGRNVLAIALSPDGELLATGHENWKVRLWSIVDGQEVKSFNCYERPYATAFSPDGKVLAAGLYSGSVVQLDLTTGRQLGPELSHQAQVWAVAYSPCGNLLAAASGTKPHDTLIHIWDISVGPPYYSLTLPSERPVHAEKALVSFSRDGTILVETCDDGSGRFWSLPPIPTYLHEIQLRTWIALGSRLNAQGGIAAIPWEQHRKLRNELHNLVRKAQ